MIAVPWIRSNNPTSGTASSPGWVSYNRRMRPFLLVTTGFLVGVFLFLCVGAWRIYRGHVQPRPFVERAAIAGIFAVVGWQALTWLRADHTVTNQARVIGVWVQLLSAFGISGVLLAHGWLVHRRIN